jgi:hypothetical protein
VCGIAGIAEFAEPELSIAPFGPRRGRLDVLEGHSLPERIPGRKVSDDAPGVPEGLPSELPRSLLPDVESPPPLRLPYLNSPCESAPPASSRLRPLRDGSRGVLAPCRLGSRRVVPTSPPPPNRRSSASGPSARSHCDRPGGIPRRRQQSLFPSFHLRPERGLGFPVLALLGFSVGCLPALQVPLQGFAPRFEDPA